MIVIGCDPGLSGAVSLIDCTSGELLECADIPTCDNGSNGSMRNWVDVGALEAMLADWSARHAFARDSVHACIERPVAAPTIGAFKRKVPAQTIAAQFDTFGSIRALIARVSREVHFTSPQTWKRLYGLAGDDAKNEARACCLRLYPDAPVQRVKDHNRAESILIAHWLRREIAS